MFDKLITPPADKILALMQEYKDDPRPHKIDLGVGVYKDKTGGTPIMRAVKKAEAALHETQKTKSYVGLAGDAVFGDEMVKLVLGPGAQNWATARIATPGGTGAVRQAFELARNLNPDLRVFVSNPSWPNHVSILNYLGIETVLYRYFDAANCIVDFNGMIEDLHTARKGDVVLLHGCCHNPTGANLSHDQWREVAAVLQKTGATAMVDIAYQGFGDGLEEDAAATRLLAAELPEMMIAASCSKNFGIYRERAGILITVDHEKGRLQTAQAVLNGLNRQNYSFPPDHGEALVARILTDDGLRNAWQSELEEMRQNMLGLRQQLASELARHTNSNRFDFVAHHRGMFSLMGLAPDQVERLKSEHGVYMVGDSRVNIAGLNENSVPVLAQAIARLGT